MTISLSQYMGFTIAINILPHYNTYLNHYIFPYFQSYFTLYLFKLISFLSSGKIKFINSSLLFFSTILFNSS